jgi:hypothetical protein
METIWCSEFDQLHELLGAHGGEVVIERALEPGVLPLHAVTFDEAAIASERMTDAWESHHD